MRILNQTNFVHGFTMGIDNTGREYLSFVVKGTFAFPDLSSDTPRPAKDQRPLVMADEFTGKPGFSATLWETDFAFRKARCDVVLQGAAYAPGGVPAERVRVGVKVGGWSKQLDVVGQREWQRDWWVVGDAITSTKPHPFTRQPFSYDTAFGGPDRSDPEDKVPPVYAPNPVGCGFATVKGRSQLSGQPLPNTEEVGEEVTSPYGMYRPMALGPIARGWPDRLRYGGTYDENWEKNTFPFLPADFDERFFQMAPEDQQIAFPEGGMPIILVNLTPRGREEFRLPDTALSIRVFQGRETRFDDALRPDTLIFDTEARVFMFAWRIWVPLRRTISEFTEAWVGPTTRAMRHAHETGKRYVRAVAAVEAGP